MHSTFGTSTLVRQLASWAPAEADATGPDVAERLSAWLGPVDAMRLQAVHQALGAVAAAAPPPRPSRGGGGGQDLDEDIRRVRGVLAQAIAKDPLALAGLQPTDTEDPGYGPWQQRHIELQRQMAQMVGALRDHVRHTVARASPRLRQLATLDAAFEELLAAREQALLPTTLAHLERRHRQLRTTHQQAREAAGQPDDPARWREPGGWLATFAHDWRQALLAELDLRLEPVLGLADAWRHDFPLPT